MAQWWLSEGAEWWLRAGAAGGAASIPVSGRSPGEGHGNPLHCSCLENPLDGGAWQATVHRVVKSQTQLKQLRLQACMQWQMDFHLSVEKKNKLLRLVNKTFQNMEITYTSNLIFLVLAIFL